MKHRPTRRDFLRAAGVGAAGLSALTPFAAANAAFAEQVADERRERRRQGFKDLHRSFDLAEGVTYLNHASIGTMPRAVREALSRYVETCERNPWLHIWGDAWEEAWDRARRRSAEFVGCDPEELAITHNTTEGFNILAHGLPLGKRDEVLFSSLNHVGASRAWEQLAGAGRFRVRRFELQLDDAPGWTEDDLVELHTREIRKRTRVLVVPHIDNVLGIRLPIGRIADAARARGVEFIAVDGAQTAGMIPLDLASSGVDFYATSGHKWLQTAKGLGLLYVRREIQSRVRPMWVTWGQDRWKGTARVFEDYGTRDLPKVLSLANAIEFQESLGPGRLQDHLRNLHRHAIQRIDASKRLTWKSPRQWKLGGSLWAWGFDGIGSREVFDRLYREQGFVFRPFETSALNTIRISPNAANRAEEVDRIIEALEALLDDT